jgi:hypothetical protein
MWTFIRAGVLEGRLGQWLQPSPSLSYRALAVRQELAELDVKANGFETCGRLIL